MRDFVITPTRIVQLTVATLAIGACVSTSFVRHSAAPGDLYAATLTVEETDFSTPSIMIEDIGGAAGAFYELVPDNIFLNLHTDLTRNDADKRAPFRVAFDAKAGLMTLDATGVSIGGGGTIPAAAPLHVLSDLNSPFNTLPEAKILVENLGHDPAPRTMIEMKSPGGSRFGFTNSVSERTWAFQNNASDGFLINLLGSGGNEFLIRKTGVISMGPGGRQNFVLDASGNLSILGTMNSASDRNRKTDFAEIDEAELLSRIAELPITSWTYKDDEQSVRHIGPMSQDFHAAFNVGKDDKSISVTDSAGVALAGIKALNQRCNDLAKANRKLKIANDDQRQMIEQLGEQLYELAERLIVVEASLPK